MSNSHERVENKNGRQGEGGGVAGRVFTEEELKTLADIAPYLNLSQIADYFGIHYNTFSDIRKRQKQVDVVYKVSKSKQIKNVAKLLLDTITDKDISVEKRLAGMFFYLKTQANWREADKRDPRLDNLCEKMGVDPNTLD